MGEDKGDEPVVGQEGGPPIAQFTLHVPGMKWFEPKVNGKGTGELVPNLDDPQVLKELDASLNDPKHPEHRHFEPLKNLADEIFSGKKKAWIKPAVGGMSVIVASALLGIEVARHGKDWKEVLHKLDQFRQKK